jgi:NAD(P) transhydrogenase subunit alpha
LSTGPRPPSIFFPPLLPSGPVYSSPDATDGHHQVRRAIVGADVESRRLKAEIERLQAENAALKKGATSGIRMKVSEKGAVSVYGMGRFPVTLYKEQWLKLLNMSEDIRAFIAANEAALKTIADSGVSAFAMELMPRITRAQVMDVLSSQANLAGYRAVIEGAEAFGRAFPMMMTAAGTVPAAKVFIMGVGVAGLQAIATARRLGAIVTATDVRPATKEQVESLGAKFLAVEDEEFKNAQTAGGYAKEMSKEYQVKQAALVAEHIKKQDIVITTALIPGRKAPVLVSEDMVKTMKPGSVIVDMAVEQGGNCPLSEYGKTVEKYGVKIIGPANLPGELATDASALFARNLLNFITPMVDKETKALKIDTSDEVVKGTLVTQNGQIVHPSLSQ